MTTTELELYNLIDEALTTKNAPISIDRCFIENSYQETYHTELANEKNMQFSVTKSRFNGNKYKFTIFRNNVKQDVSEEFAKLVFSKIERLEKKDMAINCPQTSKQPVQPEIKKMPDTNFFNRIFIWVSGQNVQ